MICRKVDVKNKTIHFNIPSSRTLLKTIERFFKVTNKAGVILNIAKSSFHEDLLRLMLLLGYFQFIRAINAFPKQQHKEDH
jgi:hypothetical protein